MNEKKLYSQAEKAKKYIYIYIYIYIYKTLSTGKTLSHSLSRDVIRALRVGSTEIILIGNSSH